ncbi:MAG: Rne/Rng family ribonuclease [Candidatus Omnitrophota bacterium]
MQQDIFVNCNMLETRVAVIEQKKLEQYFIERHDTKRIVGNIYKGIVESVLPGMGSSFVKLGLERNGFLYVSDVTPGGLTYDIEDVDEVARPQQKHHKLPSIGDLLKRNDEVLVQVVKGPIGTKGPRLTTNISMPGHFVVLMPMGGTVGISKRIESREERDRIRKILDEIKFPKNIGLIVRTAAEGIAKRDLAREIRYLMRLWSRIRDRARRVKAPGMAYEEYNLVLRIGRDMLTKDVSRIEIDSKDEFRHLSRFLRSFSPAFRSRVRLYSGNVPLFEKYDINRQIEKLVTRNVKLKCGGHIVIDETEGLVAIDVNSGKFVGRRNLEETVFKTNLEAAEEIARQLRLRDLGGIIVIDFIDMEVNDHRKKVFGTLSSAIERDRAKTKILNMSSLGVVEMSRQRMRKSLEGLIYQSCPYCSGKGLVKSASTMTIELTRRLEGFFSAPRRGRGLSIYVHPDVSDYIALPERKIIHYLERRFRKRIRVIGDPKLHIEDTRIEEEQ